jgi:hypothetical protein
MSLKTIRTLVPAAVAALLLIGCGSEESTQDSQEPIAEAAQAEKAKPKPRAKPEFKPSRGRNKIVEEMDADGKGMHLTATSPEGKTFQASIGDEVEVPADFPKDVPIFPGSTPMASMSSPDEGMIVTFKSSDEQQAIFDFYQSSLVEGGWKILEDSAHTSSQFSFDATKDSRKVSVVVAGTQGDSRVSVIVTPEN